MAILAAGRYLRLVRRDGWEFAQRVGTSGVVAILALTAQNEILLVEQYRPPVNSHVIELPAGLAGDIPGQTEEDLLTAAQRELLEETGFRAETWRLLTTGPVSAGLSDEILTLFLARELTQEGPGGGDGDESIRVHRVALNNLKSWLNDCIKRGYLVDQKVWSAFYFANQT